MVYADTRYEQVSSFRYYAQWDTTVVSYTLVMEATQRCVFANLATLCPVLYYTSFLQSNSPQVFLKNAKE